MTNYLIITGGSRGIGKATIQLFKENNWQVINISRTNCDIPEVKNFNIDLSDPNWFKLYGKELEASIPHAAKISLVHNASVFKKDDIATLEEHSLRSVLEFNLVSTISLNKIFLPHMQAGSSIIYIGSTLGEIAVANRASYTISKHALIGMMRATCQDLRGKEIMTACICPGFVDTSMLTDQVDKETLAAIIKEKVSAGRLIEPKEIADLIYFNALHPILNGSVIHANLGQITS